VQGFVNVILAAYRTYLAIKNDSRRGTGVLILSREWIAC
jgi:hypothetical protein